MKRPSLSLFVLLFFFFATVTAFPAEIYLAKGLCSNDYKIEEAIKIAGYTQLTLSFFSVDNTGSHLSPEFPEDLSAIKTVILSDVDSESLGLLGRKSLVNFVQQGGGLLLLGGLNSFGRGGLVGSYLADILPVEIIELWDIQRSKDGSIQTEKSAFAKNLFWEDHPRVYYYHLVKANAGAEVLLKVDNNPILTIWQVGKGKVATFTGTPLGIPEKGEVPFWQWKEWPTLLSQIIFSLNQP